MTIILHGAMSGIWFRKAWQIVTVSMLGIFPDLLGYAEKVIYQDFTLWNWYLFIHQEAWYTWIIPPIGVHVFLDWLTHNPNPPYGWYENAWIVEVVLWIALVAYFFKFRMSKDR